MRWTASAPCPWPARSQWEDRWRETLSLAQREETVGPGGLIEDAAPLGRIELVAGGYLQPGSEYRMAPHLTAGVLRGAVDAEGVGLLEWRPTEEGSGRRGAAVVRAGTLDSPAWIDGESTLPHLAATLAVRLEQPQEALRFSLRLDWARVEVTASHRGGELTATLTLTGRGLLWRPVGAALARGASKSIADGLAEVVRDVADTLRDLEIGAPLGATVEARERSEGEAVIRRAVEALGRRQRAVHEQVAAAPRWRRTRRRWRLALTDPELVEPDTLAEAGARTHRSWKLIERDLTEQVIEHRRAEPMDFDRALREALRDVLDRELAAHAARFDAPTPPLVDPLDPAGPTDPAHPVDPALSPAAPPAEALLRDSDMDTAWLASPRTAMRHLRRRDRHPTGP